MIGRPRVSSSIWFHVLAPSVPLEKLREDTDDDNYLESIENAESEVEDLANFIAEKLDIHLSPSDDEANS
jgi:hypothetical protein